MSARIAFCITTLEPGGAERQLVELVTRLPRDRFVPAVAVLAPPPPAPFDELVHTLAEHKIEATFLGGRSIIEASRIYRRLQCWLTGTRPGLLQCFLAHANVLGALAARRLNFPVVAGIRVAEKRRNGHRLAQRLTARWTDRYVCVSADVAKYATENMRLPAEKIVIVRNGVDLGRFTQASPIPLSELNINPDRRLLLFVGRLEREKRPDWLLDRMPELLSRLPQHDFVLAGRGPLERSLHAQAARIGIAERVHFIGWRGDIPRLLAAADLLLLASSAEGMPNVVLEAMAAARPVVATAVHGLRELLGDDPDQILPSRDPLAFYGAVERLASNPALAKSVGLRNRERALSLFSLDESARQYAALYDALLAPPRAEKSLQNR